MTKEDFVSLECAKILKEKGYDEPCYAYYLGETFILKKGLWRSDNIESVRHTPLYPDTNSIEAPTLYDAQKWLRMKRVFVDITCAGTREWEFAIWKLCTYTIVGSITTIRKYPTYESALNAGIIEALKLL